MNLLTLFKEGIENHLWCWGIALAYLRNVMFCCNQAGVKSHVRLSITYLCSYEVEDYSSKQWKLC